MQLISLKLSLNAIFPICTLIIHVIIFANIISRAFPYLHTNNVGHDK